jgi:hypothetical protein
MQKRTERQRQEEKKQIQAEREAEREAEKQETVATAAWIPIKFQIAAVRPMKEEKSRHAQFATLASIRGAKNAQLSGHLNTAASEASSSRVFFSYGSSILISTCKFSILTCAGRSTDFISRRPKKWLDIWSMHMPMFVLIGLHQIVHLIIEHLAF